MSKDANKGLWSGYSESGGGTKVTVGSEGYTHSTPGGNTTGHASGVQHHHGTHSSNPQKGSFQSTGSPPSGPIMNGFIKK